MRIWLKTKKWFRQISLVDKCLLFIMLLLIVQSAYNLFIQEPISQEMNTIDVIVRTAAASIFGYFLSANFVRRNPGTTAQAQPYDTVDEASSNDTAYTKCTIGFTDGQAPDKAETGKVSVRNAPPPASPGCSRLQVAVISGIGIASLAILLILRNFIQINPQSASTVSQLRDFVSASVGFLVSCGKNHTE